MKADPAFVSSSAQLLFMQATESKDWQILTNLTAGGRVQKTDLKPTESEMSIDVLQYYRVKLCFEIVCINSNPVGANWDLPL